MKEWKCGICGYIHKGAEAPDECPICKAKKENFSEVSNAARQWRCTVCGHIHEGAEPPANCPLCKSAPEKFEPLPAAVSETPEQSAESAPVAQPVKKEEAAQAGTAPPEPANSIVASSPGKRWRCLVCGHVHVGEAPPEQCPVCKAPASQFVELDAKGNPLKKDAAAMPLEKPGIIARILMALHVHPILAHFPNGILPMVVLFIAGSIFLRSGTSEFIDKAADLDTCIFYGLIFVLITMPFVIASGWLEWKKRYHGARTVLFFTKISCSLLATLCLVALVLWGWFEGRQVMLDARSRLIYFIIAVIMLLAVAIAGHLGGRLVFRDRGR